MQSKRNWIMIGIVILAIAIYIVRQTTRERVPPLPTDAAAYDTNGDGIVSPSDVIYVNNRIGESDVQADVNGDGRVTEADAEAVLQYLEETAP